MNKNNNPFANVPRVVSQAAVFILLFAVTLSCEKKDSPPEYEITEVFTSRFRIDNDAGRLLLFDQLTPELVIEPINLPKEFQRYEFVQATVGRIGAETNERGHPLVKIMQIQETNLRAGTYTIYTNSKGEFILREIGLSSDGAVQARPSLHPPIVPINLPEEFQWEYPYGEHRFVRVTYRHTGEKNPEGLSIVEIVEIREFLRSASFHVRRTEQWGYVFSFPAPHPPTSYTIPTNLPEEFQIENLYVQVMFIARGMTERGNWIVEIKEIYEFGTTPASTRITGGEATHIRYNPWQVHFTVRGRPWCGGTIIAPNFILSADHCFYDALGRRLLYLDGTPFTERCLRVHAGITCRSEINSSNTFEVERIIRHPQASGRDVILIQLSRPIPFNDTRHPINFMASTNNALFSTGSRVTATGWGGTVVGLEQRYNVHSNCLQTVDLTITNVSSQLITATGTQGIRQGLCYGDSGGPLIVRTASNEPILIGVSRDIWLSRCGGNNQTNPSRFERVDQLVPWIKGYVRPVIPTISGPTLICSWPVPAATFTVSNVPAGAIVNWTHSLNLHRVSSSGNTATFSSDVPGFGWVQATVNGIPSNRREIWAGRPAIQDIVGSHSGNIGRFRAIFPYMSNPTRFLWRMIGGPWWDYNFISNTNGCTVYIEFHNGGFFELLVEATNACGTDAYQISIHKFDGRSMRAYSTTHSDSSPIVSGAFHIIVGNVADARVQNTYDVRIYDRAGNRVKQVVANEDRGVVFDLSDVPDGNYYLHICDGTDEPVVQAIVVRNRN